MRKLKIVLTALLVLSLMWCVSAGCKKKKKAPPIPPVFQITTESLSQGELGEAYAKLLEADYGTSPYQNWTVVSGSLPPGLVLDSATGMISGIPTTEGFYSFTVEVEDSSAPPKTASKDFSIEVIRMADWTVLVFMNGDNNLEGPAIKDVNEMETVGSSVDLNIVVQLDRHPGYDTSNGDWTTCKRFYIEQDADLNTITSTEIADLGEADMGSALVLEQFATWGLTNYPALHYAIILWNHGGAWKECSNDDTNGSSLLIPETATALSNALSATGVGQFDLIGFDMCLMGTLEVDYEIRNCGLVRVASEETEPGDGWDYAASLLALANNLTMTAQQLGTQIAQDYKAFYDAQGKSKITLSVVDLTKIDDLVQSHNALANQMSTDMWSDWGEFGKSGKFAEGYAKGEHPGGYIDLGDFAYILNQTTTNVTVESLASTMLSDLQSAVVYNTSGTTYPYSQGISVYLPETSAEYNANATRYGDLAFGSTSWPQFLVDYYFYEDLFTTDPVITGLNVSPATVGQGSPVAISGTATGTYLVDVRFTIEQQVGGYYYFLNNIPLDNTVTLPNGKVIPNWFNGDNDLSNYVVGWESECFVVTDGTVSEFALTEPIPGSSDYLLVFGDFSKDGGATRYDATALFNRNTLNLEALAAFVGNIVYPVEPENGDLFRPYYKRMEIATSNVEWVPGIELTYGASGFALAVSYLPDGDYYIGFEARDVAENWGYDITTVTVIQP